MNRNWRQPYYSRRPDWDFTPPGSLSMALEEVSAIKHYYENMENEIKEKHKNHDKKKEGGRVSIVHTFVLLGLFSPIIGLGYAGMTIWGVVQFLNMVQSIK